VVDPMLGLLLIWISREWLKEDDYSVTIVFLLLWYKDM
jgi:hypothetical protein